MSKPIQVFATHTRGEHEQFGQMLVLVLCDDGRIFQDWSASGDSTWTEVKGPWIEGWEQLK